MNFHGNNPATWDWYMDPLIFSGEGASFYVPFQADPRVGGTAYVGLNSVWRTQDGGGDPYVPRQPLLHQRRPEGRRALHRRVR